MKKNGIVKQAAAFLLAVCVIAEIPQFTAYADIVPNIGAAAEDDMAGHTAETDPQAASVGERFEVDGIGYKKITENTVQLTDWENAGGTASIPERVPGTDLTVVSIGKKAFFYNYSLKNVVMPDTITEIGNSAFHGSGITDITLSENLTVIGTYAFAGTADLNITLELPDSVTAIGSAAFLNSGITRIRLPEDYPCLPDEICLGCNKLKKAVLPKNLTVIGEKAFYNCKALTTIALPESCTEIWLQAFYGCSSLARLELPPNLTSIETGAFSGCSSLETLNFPDSLTNIENSAFYNTGLNEAAIPDSITRIPLNAFGNCGNLKKLTLPDSVTYISQRAFEGISAETLEVLCKSRRVAEYAWGIGLTNIKVNNESFTSDIEEFTDENFKYIIIDTEKKQVRLTKSSKISGEVMIPEKVNHEGAEYTVTEIGEWAFMYKSGLTGDLVLPDTVKEIGYWAFRGCSGLTGLRLPKNLAALGTGAFDGCTGMQGDLIVPDGCIRIGGSCFTQLGFDTLTLPDGLAYIEESAFAGLEKVESVTLPASLRRIRFGIFQNCGSLKDIAIPEGVGYIGGNAFWNCPALTEITFSDSLLTIGEKAFYCEKEEDSEIILPLNRVVLPDQVRSVYDSAFAGRDGMSYIYTGENLRILGEEAFPADVRLTTYSQETQQTLIKNMECVGENLPVLLWDGKRDVSSGASVRVEEDIIISGSVTVADGAAVVIADGVSVTAAAGSTLTIGEGAVLTAESGSALTVETESSLINNGIINGEGSFAVNGSLTGTGTIAEGMNLKMALSGDMIADIPDAIYTGEAFMPEPKVSLTIGEKDIVYVKDTDFTYSYKNNTNSGTASVTVTPAEGSSLTGSPVTKDFNIQKADGKAPDCSLAFTLNADGKTFTAVIEEVEGAEYSFDGRTWTGNNKKTDCQPGTEYTAFIRMGANENYNASPPAYKWLTAPELEPELAAPVIEALKAKAYPNGIYVDITVNPTANADRYEIYRIAGKKNTLVGITESGKNTLCDKSPVKSASYYAVAVSRDGRFKSGDGSPKTIAFSKGTKIKKVSAVSNGMKVTWKKMKNAKKYVLYRSTKKNAGYTKIKILGKKKLSYVDKKAKKGKSYYYKIAVLTKSQPSLMSRASKKVKRK